MKDLILGTAGHIDHGKTSLIRALTGVDTDRLPEEKKRGITIELGFAELNLGDYRLGIVDVPGHERFVRNMLAGATGMDLAMLVVAADDSIKPQTLEHFEILRLLNLQAGVIALTKCDVCDEDWVELVAEEVRELAQGSFLADAPIVKTSSHTGHGLDELRSVLQNAAATAVESRRINSDTSPFRMAIDRSFTIAGHGTVVTGSVNSGSAKLGDEVFVEPGQVSVRIRGLHNHDREVEEVRRGQRAAINLGGIHHEKVERGQELAAADHLVPSRTLTAWVRMLDEAKSALKDRARVRLHLGTAEALANVRLLTPGPLLPGDDAFVQFHLNTEVVSIWNQPFVIRNESPMITIGGGQILDSDAETIRRPNEQTLATLDKWRNGTALERASAATYFLGVRTWVPGDLARLAGIDDCESVYAELTAKGDVWEINVSPTRMARVHHLVAQELSERIRKSLERLHSEFPLRSMLKLQQVLQGFGYLDRTTLHAVLKHMAAEKIVRYEQDRIALVGHGPKLSQNERKMLAQLVETYRQASIQSPTVSELESQTKRNRESVRSIISLAAADGDLVEVTDEYFLHAAVDQQLKDELQTHLVDGQGLTLSQIREILNTTRKYAVPYCEYLDKTGFTRRDGDQRYLK